MKRFTFFARTSLVLVYLVIVAGALVRMTGSGMGCPDWPKCFGYYIPPTDIKELTWAPQREFEDGQVIIHEEKLLVAEGDFTTGDSFDASQWRPYTKHDYAVFNAAHTWIEYLNRLVGALAGLAVLLMAVFSFRTKKRRIILLSWLTVGMMLFQAWLGARVVYSVLNPVKITVHMLVALLIVAIILYVINLVKENVHRTFGYDHGFRVALYVGLALSLVQIALGTQVRQAVDAQGTENFLSDAGMLFYVHRSMSILVLLTNGFLLYRNRLLRLGHEKVRWVVALILLEIATGIAMYYFDFPFSSQTFHVVAAALLFGIQFYLLLESGRKTGTHAT